jgi:hypothetical protein
MFHSLLTKEQTHEKPIFAFALFGTLTAAPGFAMAQALDPNMPGRRADLQLVS